MNLSATIIPKSDQLNADDLIAGPRTITITGVKQGASPEQPVNIHYEGDNGRPYKPCKSMRRVLISLWGDDASAYVGRRLSLYRDASVRFGADETGGIRISHMSGLDEPVSLALTVTRGKRKPYQVLPLKDTPKQTLTDVDISALVDVGNTKAREGSEALKAWWTNVLTAEQRRVIGNSQLNTWKLHAQDADVAQRKSA